MVEFTTPYIVKSGCVGSVAASLVMKKLLFIHEYVGESVSTCLNVHDVSVGGTSAAKSPLALEIMVVRTYA